MPTFLPTFPSPKKTARLGSVDLFICSPIPGISLRFQKKQDGFMFLTALRLLERVQTETDHPRRSTGLLESVNCIKTKSTQNFSSCYFSFHNQEALPMSYTAWNPSSLADIEPLWCGCCPLPQLQVPLSPPSPPSEPLQPSSSHSGNRDLLIPSSAPGYNAHFFLLSA